ncbi:MAG: hypothetical protein ACE5GA_07740 [Candidatus Zixiibacteriota bacterium]
MFHQSEKRDDNGRQATKGKELPLENLQKHGYDSEFVYYEE